MGTDWHSDTTPQTSKNEPRAVASAQNALDKGKAEHIADETFDPYVERAVDARQRVERTPGFKKVRWVPWKTSRAHTRDVLRLARRLEKEDKKSEQKKGPVKKSRGPTLGQAIGSLQSAGMNVYVDGMRYDSGGTF